MRLSAIIAAGGIGKRMGAGGSKQLMELAGRPVLSRTIEIFQPLPSVMEIVVVIDPDDMERCQRDIIDAGGFDKVSSIVAAGDTRTRSVQNALTHVDSSADTVLVHDGARPLFPADLLQSGLSALEGGTADGVVFGVPVTDTIKEADAGHIITNTPDRNFLWAAQTPQIFGRVVLEEAYASLQKESINDTETTDDASLVERNGGRVEMVPGSRENIKLTAPLDLIIAEAIIATRGGMG